MTFNSVLGTIQLGNWELGQTSSASSTATCSGFAGATRRVVPIGGVSLLPFNSILGAIQLGSWELGQTFVANFNPGRHTVSGLGTAVRQIRPVVVSGECAGLGFAVRQIQPNYGALVAIGYADAIRGVTPLDNVYTSMTGLGDGTATRTLFAPNESAAVGLGDAIRTLSPLAGQAFSCVVGSLLDVDGVIRNGSF